VCNKRGVYEIHEALREDLSEGSIWLLDEQLSPLIRNRRRIVKIAHNGDSVCCEALYATDDYLKRRSNHGASNHVTSLIYISGWYRALLRVEVPPGSKVQLCITSGNGLQQVLWQVAACVDHPQVAVFLSTALGVIGLGLGLLGVIPALKDIGVVGDFVSGVLTIGAFCVMLVVLFWLLIRRARISGPKKTP